VINITLSSWPDLDILGPALDTLRDYSSLLCRPLPALDVQVYHNLGRWGIASTVRETKDCERSKQKLIWPRTFWLAGLNGLKIMLYFGGFGFVALYGSALSRRRTVWTLRSQQQSDLGNRILNLTYRRKLITISLTLGRDYNRVDTLVWHPSTTPANQWRDATRCKDVNLPLKNCYIAEKYTQIRRKIDQDRKTVNKARLAMCQPTRVHKSILYFHCLCKLTSLACALRDVSSSRWRHWLLSFRSSEVFSNCSRLSLTAMSWWLAASIRSFRASFSLFSFDSCCWCLRLKMWCQKLN